MKNVKKEKRSIRRRKENGAEPAAKEALGTTKIKENEAHAYGSVFLFSVFLVLDKVKWHMGHTNRQEGAF